MSAGGLALTLAAGWLCACSVSDGGPRDGLMLSCEEVMSQPPAVDMPGPIRVWPAEQAADLRVYYVLSGAPRIGPVKPAKDAVRIVLLKGRARLTVGGLTKDADPGAYAVAPAGTPWSVERRGAEPLVFSLLLPPDSLPPTDLLPQAS
jgi:hypothetical protein